MQANAPNDVTRLFPNCVDPRSRKGVSARCAKSPDVRTHLGALEQEHAMLGSPRRDQDALISLILPARFLDLP